MSGPDSFDPNAVVAYANRRRFSLGDYQAITLK